MFSEGKNALFDEEAIESFHRAGMIVAKLRDEVPKIVKPGMTALDVCNTVEERTRELGGHPAFPVGVGINEVAAHYTSPPGDKLLIPKGSLVKVDFGVHLNGYVTDTAVTLCFEPTYEPLVRAADEALANAVHSFHPGVKLSEVGRIIQTTVARYGYRTIRNLTGHNIERYTVHAGKSVPNVGEFNGARIAEGEVYAIEPFVTLPTAKGNVKDDPHAYIYRFIKLKGTKDETARQVLSRIYEQFGPLPFAARWLQDRFSNETILKCLNTLVRDKCVGSYKVLVEESGMPVAQSEHTVLVGREESKVLTGRLT